MFKVKFSFEYKAYSHQMREKICGKTLEHYYI